VPRLSAGRAAVFGALISSVIAGVVFVPTASAQSGSRLCGVRLAKNPRFAGEGPFSYVYLGEMRPGGDKGEGLCRTLLYSSPQPVGYTKEREYRQAICETVSNDVGWRTYTGNPPGYNPDDICTSIGRGWVYELKISDKGEIESFTRQGEA
jgi:hypothetical protein